MSTPDESVRLAAEAQTAAREAAARMFVHSEAWSSAAAAVRAVRALELAVHAEVLGHIRRAREAGESWAAVGEFRRAPSRVRCNDHGHGRGDSRSARDR